MSSNTETPAGEQSPTSPFADVAFDLLKDARRRRVLAYLLETDGPVTVTSLAKHVARAIACPANHADVTAIRNSLHHSHLPRMADAGVIEYDPDDSIVRLTPQAKSFGSLLSVITE